MSAQAVPTMPRLIAPRCCSGEDSNPPEKHCDFEQESEKASIGASLSDSERYARFAGLLKECGFSGIQLLLISDAMTDTGLKFTVDRIG